MIQTFSRDTPTPLKNVILISLGVSLLMSFTLGSFGSWVDFKDFISYLKNLLANFTFCFCLWMGNEHLVYYLNGKVSWFERPILRLVLSFFGTIIVTLLIIFILQTFFLGLYYGVTPVNYFKNLEAHDYIGTILITSFISLFLHGRGFLIGWRDTAVEAEKLQKAHIAAQYEALKNQVNPHFLFNSLNVLSNLVYKDADLSAKFIKQLSLVYRYVLDTREKEVVSLESELDALESYIFLIKIRFGENIHVITDLAPSKNEMIVPLTLQMLFENAIKHNEISKAYPLKIEISRENETYISLKNNLQEKISQTEKSGVGLENIRSRYSYISDHPIVVEKSERHFEVKVPTLKFNG